MSTPFKSYSERSKARRALVQVYGIEKEATDAYLTTLEGKHGFYLNAVDEPQTVPQAAEEPTVTLDDPKLAQHPVAQANKASWDFSKTKTDTGPKEVDESKLTDAPAPAADPFSAFAMQQLTAPSNAAPVEAPRASTSQRTAGLKIEKDRSVKNGVKERSRGGLCRAVWDMLDELVKSTGGAVPTVADVKKAAEAKGWNVNNASIEYYQWRKHHGISGRGKKTL